MGTIESYNWSGARVVDDVLPLLFPNSSFFTSVEATWRVPKVELHESEGELRSATWIGLDGGTWNLSTSKTIVLQAGIYHHFEPGGSAAEYTAFCGVDTGGYDPGLTDLYALPSFQPFIQPFKVYPSDKIKVKLSYTRGSTTATADFTGTSSAGLPTNPVKTINIPPGTDITGYTAEWIFERISMYNKSPKIFGGSYHKLGKHDAVDFRDAKAVTDQGKSVSPDQGDSINMYDVDAPATQLTAGTALLWEVQIKHRYH